MISDTSRPANRKITLGQYSRLREICGPSGPLILNRLRVQDADENEADEQSAAPAVVENDIAMDRMEAGQEEPGIEGTTPTEVVVSSSRCIPTISTDRYIRRRQASHLLVPLMEWWWIEKSLKLKKRPRPKL